MLPLKNPGNIMPRAINDVNIAYVEVLFPPADAHIKYTI